MRGISWLAVNQSAAQEGLCTVEWVSKWVSVLQCILVQKVGFLKYKSGLLHGHKIKKNHSFSLYTVTEDITGIKVKTFPWRQIRVANLQLNLLITLFTRRRRVVSCTIQPSYHRWKTNDSHWTEDWRVLRACLDVSGKRNTFPLSRSLLPQRYTAGACCESELHPQQRFKKRWSRNSTTYRGQRAVEPTFFISSWSPGFWSPCDKEVNNPYKALHFLLTFISHIATQMVNSFMLISVEQVQEFWFLLYTTTMKCDFALLIR